MFLHLGNDVYVKQNDIVLICNLDTASVSKNTQIYLKKCEEKIAALESRLQEIDEEMADPEIGTQVLKLQDLAKEQSALNEQLEELYAQWEILAE